MRRPLPLVIDSRLRFPELPAENPVLLADLKAAFKHTNPKYHQNERMGLSNWQTPRWLETWRMEERTFSLPRGGLTRVRAILDKHGYQPVIRDRRLMLPEVEWPAFQGYTPRWYQSEGAQIGYQKQQGIIRVGTGGGKTFIVFCLAALAKQPALVIVRDPNLLLQWAEAAEETMGLSPQEIGVLGPPKLVKKVRQMRRGSSKLFLGPRLTLGLQQTVYAPTFPREELKMSFGAIFVDEVQLAAARTFQVSLDVFPAKWRLGLSADETRKDGKEFLTYDLLGDILYEIPQEMLVEEGVTVPVSVRLIPTDFSADWYRDASAGDKDFGRLLEEMMADEAREALILDLVKSIVREGDTPLFVFTQRVEHATALSRVKLPMAGIQCGLMLGGEENSETFQVGKTGLLSGTFPAAAGTFNALGTGINIPNVQSGVLALPIGKNKQFFNQVRGRLCRGAPGKTSATLYVPWDKNVFPAAPRLYKQWNSGRVEVLVNGRWQEA